MATPSAAADRPHRCGGCAATWSGLNTAHCRFGGCHQTFSGVTAFAKHIKTGKCKNPSLVGLELLDRPYPCWGSPKAAEAAHGGLEGVSDPMEDE